MTEARDRAGAFYPLVDDLAEAFARDPRTAEPARLVAHIRDRTLRHTDGHLGDDTTIFAVWRARAETDEGPVRGRLQT